MNISMGMGSRVLVLGGVLKRLGNFSMRSFKERLTFQKTVYFMQVFGLDFGYKFGWYVYGPYSTDLTKDGYELSNVFNRIPKIQFINTEFEVAFENLKEFLGTKANDADWLELLASLHILKHSLPKRSEDMIIETILKKQTHFTKEQCNEGLRFLKKWKL